MGAVALIAGMAALAWAGPEAVLNVEKPAPSRGTPAVFKFGGEDNQEFMLNGNRSRYAVRKCIPSGFPGNTGGTASGPPGPWG